ncbi:MAG TPA: adenylyltransferase/cytidyltransferase family protein [Candidatus Saccharimonadales bacterium]|nr:adenylyltransferase/cytidyltransferase family protein [Candidatus Saccharimonadales bacterium]
MKIILVGGCFDILHIGHIRFLQEAKKLADILVLLLESDASVKKTKGENRPINTQKDRAMLLAQLCIVDYVVLLPFLKADADYDKIVSTIGPSVIATTKGDPYAMHKKRQAEILKSKLVFVTDRIPNASSTRLAKLLHQEL